jgi:hypothetical protein
MNPQVVALKANRTVVAAVLLAAGALALLALVGVARLLGWTPAANPAPAPAAKAAPARQVAQAPDVALAPGETLVEGPAVPDRPAPMMPTYSAPHAPKPAPPPDATPVVAPEKARPALRVERSEERPAMPVRPRYQHPSDPGDDWPRTTYCRECGTVTAIVTYPDSWEVRVRLEDGDGRVVRYRSRPPWRLGERVRLAGGRLEPQ